MVALCVIAVGTIRAQDVDVLDIPAPMQLDSHTPDPVIARVGPSVITAREFFFSYLFGPSFIKKRPDSRLRYLEYMVQEKLLALGERARGNDKDRRVRANLDAVEGDLATEELYKEDILRSVRIPEADIRAGVERSSVEVSVRWLFAPTRTTADTLARHLRSGVGFDSLFEGQCAVTPSLRTDCAMTASLFDLQQRNPLMCRAVEPLPAGTTSGVITGPEGFYIARVDSLKRDVLVSGSAQAERRASVMRALRQQKADSMSGVYIRTLMLDADPVIERRTFDILRAYLATRLLTRETFEAWGIAERFRTAGDSVRYRDIDLYARETLVILRKQSIALGTFLQWYQLREANLKLRLVSPQLFFTSLEDLVWRMVRDELLIRRARARRLTERPAVIAQRQWWNDKLLFQIAKDSLRRTIGWSDSTLKTYYDGHPARFRDAGGARRTFADARDDVLREWYEEELSARMLHRITSLRMLYPVSIDEDAVQRIPVDAAGDPRAIEVVAAKKGGTFPRPAFPTIDPFWQAWQ